MAKIIRDENNYNNENEIERLKSLYEYEIMDTPPEESVDSIIRLTQVICDTPICLVSLLDETRQWFKSKIRVEPSVSSSGMTPGF